MNPWFKYFSLLLSYPDENFFEDLKKVEELLEREGALLHSFSEEFKRYDLTELKQEYTRLFISSFPTLPCPPYESYYREGLLLGKTSLEVSDFYQNHGFQFSLEGEAPDHVAAELEFLALTEDSLFLKRFLEWFPLFKECVEKQSSLYGKVTNFIYEFIKGYQT